MSSIKIGIIGMGHISNIYCENLCTVHENTDVVACADVFPEAAREKAEKWGIPEVLTVDEILAREDIQILVNLTPPQNHYEIIKRCLNAGKHVYTEKPLATRETEAAELVALAKEKGLMLGSAPENIYGAGVSTARELIEQGAIGKVLYADAQFRWPGDEDWHPNPSFLFKEGAGPLFDRGPYYLTVLTDLLGKAEDVYAVTSIGFPTRTVLSEPRKGEIITVETPTHVQSLMHFEGGVLCSTLLSFDLKGPKYGCIEIFGTEGSIKMQSIIGFSGPVFLSRNCSEYEQVPFVNERTNNIRGYAVSSMAQCLLEGRTDHLAPGTRAHHVVEIMEKTLLSGRTGQVCAITSRP